MQQLYNVIVFHQSYIQHMCITVNCQNSGRAILLEFILLFKVSSEHNTSTVISFFATVIYPLL